MQCPTRSVLCQFRIVLVVAGSFCAMALCAPPENPPKPNPSKPVNYVDWINRTYAGSEMDNAYALYAEAYPAIGDFKPEWSAATKAPWKDLPELSDWLGENERALDLLKRGAEKDGCFFLLPDNDDPADSRLAHALFPLDVSATSKAHRNAMKGILAQGWRNWANGDRDSLFENAGLVIKSGHHWDTCPFVLYRITGYATVALGYEAVTSAIEHAEDRCTLAGELLELLDRIDPEHPRLVDALVGERLIAWDLCQRAFVPGTRGVPWDYHQPVLAHYLLQGLPPIEFKGILPSLATYPKTIRDFDQYFDLVVKWCEAPYPAVAKSVDQFEQYKRKSSTMLIKTAAPILTRARLMHEHITAERRALHLILYLLHYRSRHGEFPKGLDELTVADTGILIDPFSGDPFRYARRGDDFKLYTVGENLTDDGGSHSRRRREGDYVYWPRIKQD